jgi:hypothetical protein
MTIHPMAVKIRKCRNVVRLPPNTSRMEAVPEENPRDRVRSKFGGRRLADGAGKKVYESPKRDSQTFEHPAPVPGGPRRNTIVFRELWAMQKWRAAKDHHF